MTATITDRIALGINSRLSISQAISAMGSKGLAPDPGVPALALDFTTGSLDPRITFSRLASGHGGTYFDSNGVLREAKVNLLLNSATLSTQSVTVTAQSYTLSFTGTGSVEISNAYTGNLAGTGASNRVSLTFIPSAGTATLTVTGAVTNAQLETGSASPYIATAGAAGAAPRFESGGLLIEESRANLETNTLAATKNVAGDTLTTDGTLAPDGSLAVKFLGDGTSGSHYFRRASSATTAAVYTVWAFLKAGSTDIAQIGPATPHVTYGYCNYNLTTGAMTAGAGVIASSNFCTNVGGGWWKCGFSFTDTGSVSPLCIIALVTAIGSGQQQVTTSSSYFYIGGVQYELGAFATSFIPTGATALTRAADSASMTGTTSTVGTILVQHDAPTGRVLVGDGATAKLSSTAAGRTVVGFNASSSSVCTNGGTVSAGAAMSIGSTVQLLRTTTPTSANAHVARYTEWTTRLSDQTLKAITA